MNKKFMIGLLLICISLVIAPFVIAKAPNFLHFVKGFCLVLGVVLTIKGNIERRKEVA